MGTLYFVERLSKFNIILISSHVRYFALSVNVIYLIFSHLLYPTQ